MSIILRTTKLDVTTEDGTPFVRFTIPTAHSSTLLAPTEIRALIAALTKVLGKGKKPATRRKTK